MMDVREAKLSDPNVGMGLDVWIHHESKKRAKPVSAR